MGDDNYLGDAGHSGGDDDEPLCPICGAYSPRSCEVLDEYDGECPWQWMMDDEP